MKTPGEGLASRPLHFIWLCDCSGSMSEGGKIQQLNYAIRSAIPHMQEVARGNPNANVLVRAIKFASGAQWHISTPTEIEDFRWTDIQAEQGLTSMGEALGLLAEQMKMPPMEARGLPPVFVLISDGQPTDDFNAGLSALMAEGWGKKAVRLGIAIGSDANLDVLERFIGHPEIRPLQANNAETLTNYIKWASTAVLKSASQPASMTEAAGSPSGGNVPIPAPPVTAPASADDVW